MTSTREMWIPLILPSVSCDFYWNFQSIAIEWLLLLMLSLSSSSSPRLDAWMPAITLHTCNHNMIASFNATKNNTRITICTKEEMNYVRACTRTHIHTHLHTRARLHRLLCIVSLILLETVCFLILWLLLCELVPFVCVLCPGSILFLNCNWHLCFSIALSNRLTASFMLCTLLWPTFDFMIDCSMAFSS